MSDSVIPLTVSANLTSNSPVLPSRKQRRYLSISYEGDRGLHSRDRIAFASNASGRFEIYIINPDGTNLQQATLKGGDWPSWSFLDREDQEDQRHETSQHTAYCNGIAA